MCGEQARRLGVLMLSDRLELLPGRDVCLRPRLQPPERRLVSPRPVADAGEVREQQAGRLHGIVPGFQRDDERQPGLDENGELECLEQDAAVGRDESVPGAHVVTECEQELPVVELNRRGHAFRAQPGTRAARYCPWCGEFSAAGLLSRRVRRQLLQPILG